MIFSFFIRTKLQVIIDASSLDSVLRAPKHTVPSHELVSCSGHRDPQEGRREGGRGLYLLIIGIKAPYPPSPYPP